MEKSNNQRILADTKQLPQMLPGVIVVGLEQGCMVAQGDVDLHPCCFAFLGPPTDCVSLGS